MAGIDADHIFSSWPCGPGGFESGWQLRHGLDVREGLPLDVTVDEWLFDYVRRERAIALPSSMTASA